MASVKSENRVFNHFYYLARSRTCTYSPSIRQKNIILYDTRCPYFRSPFFSPYFAARSSVRLSFPQRTPPPHEDGIKCRLMNRENRLTKSTQVVYIYIYICDTYLCGRVYGYFFFSLYRILAFYFQKSIHKTLVSTKKHRRPAQWKLLTYGY